MNRALSCPFCPHRIHDGRDCRECLPNQCVGANEDERRAYNAPDEILSWLRELIEADTWGGSFVGATDVVHVDDHVDVETKQLGKWRIKVERAP